MRIKIQNASSWRTRELRSIVTRVKRMWFDTDDRTYTIKFKNCGTRYKGAHGTAWYTRGYCEVYIPRDGYVDEWFVRVVRHELLHLKQCDGGKSWEIQQRRADRKWCKVPELRERLSWIKDIKLQRR